MGIIERIFPNQVKKLESEITNKYSAQVRKAVAQAYEYGAVSGLFSGEKWPGGLDKYTPRGIDHWALRQNARIIVRESSEARTLINRSTDLVVGAGVTLNLEPRYEMLGITPEEAEVWAKDVELLFDLWAQSKWQHKSKQLSFYEAMRLIKKYSKRDGEYFIRLYYSQDPSLILPLQFEIIDPNQIRGDAFTFLSFVGSNPNDGITRDANGAEVSYKVWVKDGLGNLFHSVEIPRYGPKSGRTYMIHGFSPDYAGQGRGFSELGLDIQDYKDITDYKTATVRKAINQSNIAFTTESDSEAPASNPFNSMGGAGPLSPTEESEVEESGSSSSSPEYIPINKARFTEPGSVGVFGMQGREKLVPFPQTAPSETFRAFVDAVLEPGFNAQGMPLEVARMSFKNNYSASQATLLLNNLNNDVELFILACQGLDPIFYEFMAVGISVGKISCPGWQDPVLRAAWTAHRWDRPPMPNIDRLKSMNADKGYAELGSTSLTDIAMRLNGSSYRTNVSKLRREYKELPPPPWAKTDNGGEKQKNVQDDNQNQDENQNKD